MTLDGRTSRDDAAQITVFTCARFCTSVPLGKYACLIDSAVLKAFRFTFKDLEFCVYECKNSPQKCMDRSFSWNSSVFITLSVLPLKDG